ncbi:MAG: SGNH/GDSL hydrolase family protein [Gemmatimonadota bacterium]|nr:SGNH/GDSL hydrolase family protein [Gemmatimonadota bacterium]
MNDDRVSRRQFVVGTGSALGLALWPSPSGKAVGERAQLPQDKVVLFQGDSITDAGRSRTSQEANEGSALGNGYPLLIAAQALRSHPERTLRFFNRGVSGNRVPDLRERWETDTLALESDILSILIGVNDFWHKILRGIPGTVADYEAGLGALLDVTRRALPRVSLVVMEPFVLRCGSVDSRWFPEFDDRREAAARVARRGGATFVALQKMFDDLSHGSAPEHWARDGVHPTPAGHAAIAERWREVVGV